MSVDPNTLNAALSGYGLMKARIEQQIAEIERELKARHAPLSPSADSITGTPAKRKMSAAARRRIGDAQRKRWAAAAARKSTRKAAPVDQPAKRHISARGKRAIAAATKKRWAEYRAQKAAAAKANGKTAAA